MFYLLLVVTFLVALISCYIVIKAFDEPIDNILREIVTDNISKAWTKYIKFAIYVVGISGGVRIWEIEKYITAPSGPRQNTKAIVLTPERWTLEIYRTLIGSLKSIAWMLLIFFGFTLVAYVVLRVFGKREV